MTKKRLVKRGTVYNSSVVKMESSTKHTKKASYEEVEKHFSFTFSRDKETEKSSLLALLARLLHPIIKFLKMVFGT